MTIRRSLPKIRDDVEFMPHQVEGIQTLAKRSSFILADDMGLGKTLQALALAAIDFEDFGARRVLVVCPVSLKGNWEDEIKQHTHFTSTILDGSPQTRRQQILNFATDFLIVNYEQVVSDGELMNGLGFDIVIYDEGHAIKNPKAYRTKACLRLRAKRHFILTGSPILNQVDDLWALLHRVAAGEFPSYWRFVNRYAVFGGYKDKQIVGIKEEAELKERIRPYVLRREKSLLDLPEKLHVDVRVDLHPEQRRLYDQLVTELRLDVPGDDPMEIENALTKFLRLKQICGTTAAIPGHADHSSKLDRAVEMCEELIANGRPVVVFTQFRSVLQCLTTRLTTKGIDWQALHGDVPKPDRQSIVRAWTESAHRGRPQVFACMFQVAGVGLTLTAASDAIFLDELFVPKLNEQAEDRLHRIGAKHTVTIHHMIARNSVESRIRQILKQKRETFGAVMASDSNWKKKLIAAVLEEEEDE